MNAHTALIAGATGLVGSHLLHQLLEDPAWDRVIALARRPLSVSHPKLDARLADFARLSIALEDIKADALFCTLGTTIKQAGSQEAFRRVDHDYPLQLAKWASRTGVEQYLLVSAMGANPSSRIFYNRVKGEVERDIAALGIPSLTIVRPSLLLGERSEHRRGEAAGAWIFRHLRWLFNGPLAQWQPNRAEDVARVMLRHARSARPGVQIVLAQEMHDQT